MHVLDVRPGITDPASIKFRNENELMEKAEAPDEERYICFVTFTVNDLTKSSTERRNECNVSIHTPLSWSRTTLHGYHSQNFMQWASPTLCMFFRDVWLIIWDLTFHVNGDLIFLLHFFLLLKHL